MTEKENSKLYKISNAPHIGTKDSVPKIMWMVVIALMPACIFSVFTFGIKALILLVAGVLGALAAEAICQYFLKHPITVFDGSAAITGLLVAMNVPPEAPFWVVIIGSFFAVIIVKQLFGGLGFNIFNPALMARAFMMASWPTHMASGWHNFGGTNSLSGSVTNTMGVPPAVFDAITTATPLALIKDIPRIVNEYGVPIETLQEFIYSSEMIQSHFIGNIGGCIGETSALLLLVGGIFLLIRRIITWHIPVSYIGTVAILFFIYFLATGEPHPHFGALYHVLGGGLFLGAFFMATDMVTSPITTNGMLLFGIGCGVLTFVIRAFGGYPEGVSYSIILMNAVVPLIDRYIKPKVFGTVGKEG